MQIELQNLQMWKLMGCIISTFKSQQFPLLSAHSSAEDELLS